MTEYMRYIIIITICAFVTLLERAFPFLIFRGRKVPEQVVYLGKVLPMAIICTLVFYCMRETDISSMASLPQIAGCVVTVLLHMWKRNTMLSIAGGTASCMLLTQYVASMV